MKAGKLNRTITFQRKTGAYDDHNQKIATWADSFTVWAEIITTGGREFYAAQKLNAETSAVFRVRYDARIDNEMRVKYGNKYYQIISVNDVNGRHSEMLVSAKEVK